MDRRPRLLLVCIAWVAAIWPAGQARAHGDSVSALQLKLESTALRASVTLNYRDLSLWIPPGPDDYPSAVVAAMRQARGELLEISYDQARNVAPTDFAVSVPAPGEVRIDLAYPAPPPGATTLDVRTLHVDRLPTGHHQILTIEDARRPERGILIAQESLGAEQDAASIDIPKITAAPRRLKLVSADAKPPWEPTPPMRSGAIARWIAAASIAGLIVACLMVRIVKKPLTLSTNREAGRHE
jgi:hypothetical protein